MSFLFLSEDPTIRFQIKPNDGSLLGSVPTILGFSRNPCADRQTLLICFGFSFLFILHMRKMLHMSAIYVHCLKGYAFFCGRPLLAPRDCHFGASVPPFWHPWRNHFSTSGPPWETILAPRDHPGGPWEQQDGHEVVRSRLLIDFGMMLRPILRGFLAPRLEIPICFGFVPMSFFDRFLSPIFVAWGSEFQVFAEEVLQKATFHIDVVLLNLGCICMAFLKS